MTTDQANLYDGMLSSGVMPRHNDGLIDYGQIDKLLKGLVCSNQRINVLKAVKQAEERK
jgi:hypothetical protein